MQIKKFFLSRAFNLTTWIVAFMIIMFFVFSAGVHIGIKKATNSYERRGRPAYNMPPNKMGSPSQFMERGELGDTHGAVGKIMKIEGNVLTVQDKNNEERTITIDSDTEIREFKEKLSFSDLVAGDVIAVFGETNSEGQIVAKLVRIFPKPDEFNN